MQRSSQLKPDRVGCRNRLSQPPHWWHWRWRIHCSCPPAADRPPASPQTRRECSQCSTSRAVAHTPLTVAPAHLCTLPALHCTLSPRSTQAGGKRASAEVHEKRSPLNTKEGAAIRALAVQPSSTHGAHRTARMERVQSSMRVRDTPVRMRCHQGASATSARLIQSPPRNIPDGDTAVIMRSAVAPAQPTAWCAVQLDRPVLLHQQFVEERESLMN
jgi:hypothetical protein